MREIRDRIEQPELVCIGGDEPVPEPFTWHIREEYENGKPVKLVHKRKLYGYGYMDCTGGKEVWHPYDR